MGQVLEGLLEDARNTDDEGESAREVPRGGGGASRPALPPALWERMLSAVDRRFDGDNDGDERGKG